NLLLKTGEKTGVEYTKNLINSQVVPSYEDVSLPAVTEYRRLMDNYQKKLPLNLVDEDYQALPYSFVSFEGFLNAKLLVEILKKLPDLSDPSALPRTVENMNNLDLGIGVPINFNKKSHQGLHEIYYTTVKNDRFVPIIDWKQWSK
ncbi:MAG: ABC transporter substrate-binding protein, partial [Crocosphaera sp.]